MSENIPMPCPICDSALQTEKEKSMGVCFECRRYGLIYGCWPENKTSLSPHVNAS
jgi:hypothetical protein